MPAIRLPASVTPPGVQRWTGPQRWAGSRRCSFMLRGRRRRSSLRFVTLVVLVALFVAGPPARPSRPGARPARAATGDAVDLLPVRLAHAHGAELEWTRYTGPS